MSNYSLEEKTRFIEDLNRRTKQIALDSIRLSKEIPKTEEGKIILRQLIRSATSVGANYRAACRGRSQAEYFAKLSITVEEADEVLYWPEILEESELVKADLSGLKDEVTQIVFILAIARKNTK
ncbi:MAG: four helix bundle protein [Cyclobacteriaceae bacterium]